MDGRSERDAIDRCRAGDRDAFAVIVRAHQDRVYALALRWSGGDRSEAADLTQECFLRAFVALARFDAARPLRPWILRIALNVCRDAGRRRAARPPAVGVAEADAFAAAEPGPEASALAAERRRAVRHAVGELPPEQRLLVVLAYDRELPLREIAAALGLPVTIVKNRLYRARRRLAARLGEVLDLGPAGTGGMAHGARDGARDGLRAGAASVAPLDRR